MKKLTLEEFKIKVANVWGDTYKVLSETYESSKKDMTFECREHGEFTRTPNMFLHKKCGCPKCGPGRGGANKLAPELVLAELKLKFPTFEFPNFLENYKDTQHKIEAVCLTHGAFKKSTALLRTEKGGCPSCNVEEGIASRTYTKDIFVTKAKERHGDTYSYDSLKYRNSKAKIEIVCPVHGVFSQSASVHLRVGCRQCGIDRRTVSQKITFAEFESRAKKIHCNKYTYNETGYESMTTPVSINCSIHGEFKQVGADHIHSEAGCPKCSGSISKGELELKEYLTQLGVEHKANYKYVGRKEADAFVPTLNIAIEYDGLPWHSTKFKSRAEQINKSRELADLGITLIRIFEDEWQGRNKQVKSLLAARLKVNSSKLYARTCCVVDVSNEQAREFYNEHHIQGWKRSGTNKGLRYKDELVAVMTFSTGLSARQGTTDPNHLELVRFASSLQVLGGASRLLKALIKETGAKKITSYSDNRLFSGGMYEALGFTKGEPTPPSYTYWKDNSNERLHKSKFQHKHLPKLLDKYDPTLTEKQNCENNGYYQIYDDGLTKWELTV